MAGTNRIHKIGKETRTFSIQIETEIIEKLREIGTMKGHSLGYMLRQAADDIVEDKTFENIKKVFIDEIKKSPLIIGESLPDGQKYSEYVADRIIQSVDKKINK
tara:strand:+ start:384 stop:695 length:312 start_codon:yes stop_codon:yes gene_type:complete